MNARVTVYMTIGIPGSGKSTWVESNLNESLVWVALDGIRREVYGYFPQELDDLKERTIWNRALEEGAKGLLNGKNVLIDSMALTRQFRQRIFNELERRTGISFRKVAIFLDTPPEVAAHRNLSRSKQVAVETILRLSSFLEPPEAGKEFDEVIRITPND